MNTKKEANVTMANKKLYKVAALALLSVMGLTACNDEIVAKPTGYDTDTVITITNDGKKEEVYHNIENVIYDAYREGAMPSDVLDELLYQYSVTMLGRYNRKSALRVSIGENEITLKEAAKAAANASSDPASKEIVNKFVKAHRAYWSVNAQGKRVDDNGHEVADNADVSDREIDRVTAKWNAIEERIAEAMYDKISSGTYAEDNLVSERKFLKALKFEMKKVADYKSATTIEGKVLTPDIEKKDVWGNFLTRDNYQPKAALADDEKDNVITYIEDEIIPSIYRALLTEQYILDETYNTLGRSYARKVNVIAITNNDNYNRAAPALMDLLVKKINTKDSVITLDTFKAYANVWRGVGIDASNTIAADLIANGGVKEVTFEGQKYIQGTKFGDMMENYSKISSDPLLNDESIESDFTGNSTHTKEIGKELKSREIQLVDYITTGWFTKSSGVEKLPSEITSRLFNIGVSNALDRADETDRFSGTEYDATKDYNKYVAKINGKYYLKKASAEQGDGKDDILFYDQSSKTYYVVQIEEAVNATKLSKDSSKNYAALRNDNGIMEKYVNEILKVVASNSTYETLSKKYWLEKMELKYHDQVVYDYFKNNFPELFED